MQNPLLTAALALLLTAAPIPAQTQSLAERIGAIAAGFLKEPGAVGLSIGVARNGVVLIENGYGIADAEFDVLANGQTMFRIGSITKQFTSAAVMKWIEAGKLSLDDPLAKLLPDFATGDRTITVHELLNHTSGIPSYTDVGEAWQKQWPLELSHQQLLALIADRPFDFEPGTDWHYNNTGYYLLGMILEQLSDRSYAAHVQDTLFTPLGLTRTRYDSNSELIKNRAQGYALHGGVLANDDLLGMSQPGGAGGLLSTGGDLVRWSVALSTGKVVTPESFAKMCESTILPNGRDTHYGFGLMRSEVAGHPSINHGGGIHGFNSMLLWIPDADLHVAVISNGERLRSNKVADAIVHAALGIEKTAVQDRATTAEQRSKLVGKFRIADLELSVRVFADGEQVMFEGEGQQKFRILWQGGSEFRASFDTDVKIVFADDASSFDLHQSGAVFRASRVE